MKIAITAHGNDCMATADSRFGRADYFMVFDQATRQWEAITNKQNLEAAHGAGIQAGQTLANSGAAVLITGHVGPKAFRVLQAAKINVYAMNDTNASVQDTLAAFETGALTAIAAPNALELK